MTEKEEVKSKVYKAVKKDGKCVLVKKQRPKPKKAKAKTEPKPQAQRPAVQTTLRLPSREQIIATKAKEDAIRVANRPAPKPNTTTTDSLTAELARLRQQILGVTKTTEKVPEAVSKPEVVKPESKEPQMGLPVTDAIQKAEKQSPVSYNPLLNKVTKKVILKAYEALGPEFLKDAKKQKKEALIDVLFTFYPRALDDIDGMSKPEIEEYLKFLSGGDSTFEQGGGANGTIDGGLYDTEITDMMKNVKSFQGVIASDEIDTMTPRPAMSFVMNKDPRGSPGSHWVAVYIDTMVDKECCYYDPLGNPPSEDTRRQLKELMNKINSTNMCKFKVNTMKNQKSGTDTCGFMAIRFLKDMINGKSFKQATGYSDTKKDNSDVMEDKAEKLANKFGYI
jgi:hypothetical protein